MHAGARMHATVLHGTQWVRASLCANLEDGAPACMSVPFDGALRARLTALESEALAMRGEPPRATSRAASRAGLLHLRALLALDASQHGATHREIAHALFGDQAVRDRWGADGELRAQVRHLLTRADGLMRHGYRALAGTPASREVRKVSGRAGTAGPGDEIST